MGRKRRRGRDDDLFQVAKVRDGVRRLAEEPEGVRRMAERFGWLEVWRVGKSVRRMAERFGWLEVWRVGKRKKNTTLLRRAASQDKSFALT